MLTKNLWQVNFNKATVCLQSPWFVFILHFSFCHSSPQSLYNITLWILFCSGFVSLEKIMNNKSSIGNGTEQLIKPKDIKTSSLFYRAMKRFHFILHQFIVDEWLIQVIQKYSLLLSRNLWVFYPFCTLTLYNIPLL